MNASDWLEEIEEESEKVLRLNARDGRTYDMGAVQVGPNQYVYPIKERHDPEAETIDFRDAAVSMIRVSEIRTLSRENSSFA